MHRTTFGITATTVAALILLAAACSAPNDAVRASSSVKPAADRHQAPDFALTDSDGRQVRLSDYRGQVVLLNFWATWCGPCKLEIPWFVEFEREHKNRGFAVLGISMDEGGWAQVKPYLSRAKVNYRVLMGNDSVAVLYGGVDSLPTSFLIDREGRIASVHVGLVGKADYESDIEALLGQESGAHFVGAGAIPAVVLPAR